MATVLPLQSPGRAKFSKPRVPWQGGPPSPASQSYRPGEPRRTCSHGSAGLPAVRISGTCPGFASAGHLEMVEDGLDVSIEGGQCGPDLALGGSDEGECKPSRARHDFRAVSGSDTASIPAFPIKPALPAVFEEEFDVLKQRLLMDLGGEEVMCAALVETVRDVASGEQGMGGDRHACRSSASSRREARLGRWKPGRAGKRVLAIRSRRRAPGTSVQRRRDRSAPPCVPAGRPRTGRSLRSSVARRDRDAPASDAETRPASPVQRRSVQRQLPSPSSRLRKLPVQERRITGWTGLSGRDPRPAEPFTCPGARNPPRSRAPVEGLHGRTIGASVITLATVPEAGHIQCRASWRAYFTDFLLRTPIHAL